MHDLIQQTLERLNQVNGLAKAGITTQTGLVYYDLEAEAKRQYPVLAPIRKRMPRIGKKEAGQGLAVHWNYISNPNSTNVFVQVAQGQRGGQLTPTVVSRIATYAGIGVENVVTWEADYAAEGYDDVRAQAQRMTLDSLILGEEPQLLWGLASAGLGQTPTPTGAQATVTGGSLSNGTYYVYCVALSLQGYNNAIAQSPIAVVPVVTRTNAGVNSSTTMNGGVAELSAASSGITTSGSNNAITAKVTAVKGAAAYAWFIGASAGASNAYIYSITTLNTVTILSQPSTGQTANYTGSGTDYSNNTLAFDGLITQACNLGGYFNSLDGAAMTPDGANGIVEWDAALKYFWDTYRTGIDRIYCGSQVIRDATKAVATGSGNAAMRINLQNDTDSLGNLTGSMRLASYTNKFAYNGAMDIPIEIHPNMPDGHVFFDLEKNPYPTADIPLARAVRTRRDYFMVVWPIVDRTWQNGCYADEVLQVYVPYGMGLISNIGPGVA